MVYEIGWQWQWSSRWLWCCREKSDIAWSLQCLLFCGRDLPYRHVVCV